MTILQRLMPGTCALVLSAAGFTPLSAAADEHGRCGLLFFSRYNQERQKGALFSMTPGGADLTRNSPWKGSVGDQSEVSPDARFIIESRWVKSTENYALFRISTYGGKWERLTDNEADYADPAISPDSTHLAYTRYEPANEHSVYVMDLATSATTLIAESARLPGWAPSGRVIFSKETTGGAKPTVDLFTAERDGSDVVQLTSTPDADEYDPAYSPTGDQILFERYPHGQQNEYDGPYADIWMMNSDGSEARPVTDRQDDFNGLQNPSWSASGTWISHEFVSDGFRGVLTARPDGSGAKYVTERGNYTSYALFSPNGKKIVLSVHRNGRSSLLLARANGTNERFLTRKHLLHDTAFGWPGC